MAFLLSSPRTLYRGSVANMAIDTFRHRVSIEFAFHLNVLTKGIVFAEKLLRISSRN
jgi:hypothetical protein